MIAFLLGPLAVLGLTQAGRFFGSALVGAKIAEGKVFRHTIQRVRRLRLHTDREVEEAGKELDTFTQFDFKNFPPEVKRWEGRYLLTDDEAVNFFNSLAFECSSLGVMEPGKMLRRLSEAIGLSEQDIGSCFMNGISVDPEDLRRLSRERLNDPALAPEKK